jgi:pimeloyl-ACP methyl ester carboxylesterase
MRRPLIILVSLAAALSTVVSVPAAAEPEAFTAPPLRWAPCPEDPADATLQCATLLVPVDWARPRGAWTEVAVARRLATDPSARIGSLLINPGGPGGSGVDFAIFGQDYFSADLRRHFDLVGFDPRGVARSHPVLCSLDLVRQFPNFVLNSQSEFDAVVDYNKRLNEDCRRHTGPVFDHVDMLSVVRDMDALRAAVGDRKLTYYGVSYGSLNGQQYAERFPDRVRAIVADSNMDHSLGTRDFLLTQGSTVEDSWREFVAWCDRTASCALHGRDVRALWNGLLARAERGELPNPSDPTRAWRPEDLIGFVIGAFYGPSWSQLAEVLDALDAGRPLPFLTAHPKAQQDEAVEFSGVAQFCEDWSLPVRDFRQYAELVRAQRRVAPDQRWSSNAFPLTVACLGSPQPVANPQHQLRVRDLDRPLLLVNALHDPATGYNWGSNAARQLGRDAVLLTYDGWGHGVYGRSECTTAPVDRYLISLTLPARGTHCPGVEPTAGLTAQQRAALPTQPTFPAVKPQFPY